MNAKQLVSAASVLVIILVSLTVIGEHAGWGAGEQCGLKPPDQQMGCYEQVLDDIVRHTGSKQALTTLQEWVTTTPSIQRQAHPLAHHIGRISYAHYGALAPAFLHCTDAFHNGCYHGVLESHLSGIPHLTPVEVNGVCRGVKDPQRPAYTHFLCIHGLGHGLMMYSQSDMFEALTYCDGLAESIDQENCYGGVFMQNIVEFTSQRDPGHSHGSHGGHTATAEPRKHLDPADPLYPCTAVAKKYLRACYRMQSSAVLSLNGHDFPRALSACQKVPPEYLNICIQSVGREVSAFTMTNPGTTKAICSIALPDLIGQCLKGAAKDFIYTHADAQRGIALCRMADEVDKQECYKGIAEVLSDIHPDQGKRSEACQSADRSYRSVCRGARWWLLWLN